MIVAEAAVIPRGYGVAWWRVDARVAVCFPVPFNIVAGYAHRVWFACVRGLQSSAVDRLIERAIAMECQRIRAGLARDERRVAFREGFQYLKESALADCGHGEQPQLPEYMQ